MVSEQTISFVRDMVARFPGMGALLEEHIKDNDEILPHVFFGDVTRYVLSLLSDSLPQRRELRDILDYLERAYASGDEQLQELIAVSFLENFPFPDEPGAEIRGMIGPHLKRQLHMSGW
jgi:hypothetical protein